MRVGLIDIEPKIVNTAYMQISQYHKERNDTVEWWTPLEHHTFDRVYCSSLFDFTDKSQIPKGVITGGTGYSITKKLPKKIEQCDCDYSIYPRNKVQYLWLSIGCIRNCPFCCVRQKEGYIRSCLKGVGSIEPEYIKIMDNNFFANPKLRIAKALCEGLNRDYKLDFQGVDVRILNENDCIWLNNLKHRKQIKIAWDNPKEDLVQKLKQVTKWISAYKLMCYVLIGYWSTSEEDLYRVETLRELGIDPFVMPYNKKNKYQKNFTRWVNHKAIFNSAKWAEYQARWI